MSLVERGRSEQMLHLLGKGEAGGGGGGGGTIDLKKVQPHQRVREFPSEPFKANANKKLFCVACREELCLKLSSIRNHVQSVKHKEGVKKMELKEARQKDIADVLKRHNEATHARGESTE